MDITLAGQTPRESGPQDYIEDILFSLSLLLGAKTGNLLLWSLRHSLWGSWPRPRPLTTFQWLGLSNQCTLLLTENCLQFQMWCPYRVGMVSTPVCASKVKNSSASTDHGHSTASQGCCHVCLNLPTSTLSNFFASAKPIFKMDLV